MTPNAGAPSAPPWAALRLGVCFLAGGSVVWALFSRALPHLLRSQQFPVYAAVAALVPCACLALDAVWGALLKGRLPVAAGGSAPSRAAVRPEARPWFRRLGRVMIWVAAPAVLFFTFPRGDLNGPVDHLHESEFLLPAAQIREGKTPFKDVLMIFGVGLQYAQPLLSARLFGDSLAGWRTLAWFTDPSGALACYALAAVVLGGGAWAWLFVAMALGQPLFLASPRAALGMAAFALVVASFGQDAFSRRRFARLAGAGVLAGAAFLYSHEGGVVALGSIALFFLLSGVIDARAGRSWKPAAAGVAAFSAGAFLVILPFALWLLGSGAWGPFWEDMFLVGRSRITFFAKPLPPLPGAPADLFFRPWIFFRSEAYPARWWFPVGLFLFALSWALKSRSDERPFLLLSLAGLFSFTIALGRPDLTHWFNGVAPLWPLLALSLKRLWGWTAAWRESGPSRRARGARLLCGSLLLLGLARYVWVSFPRAFSAVSAITWRFRPAAPAGAPAQGLERWGMSGAPEERVFLEGLVSRVRRYAGEGGTFYNFTPYAMVDYMAGVTEAVHCWPLWWAEEQVTVGGIVRDLAVVRPRCILIRTGAACPPAQGPIARFIEAEYKTAETWNGFSFLVPLRAKDTDL